eukprot:5885030-Amphidinium_carterae.1
MRDSTLEKEKVHMFSDTFVNSQKDKKGVKQRKSSECTAQTWGCEAGMLAGATRALGLLLPFRWHVLSHAPTVIIPMETKDVANPAKSKTSEKVNLIVGVTAHFQTNRGLKEKR